MRRHTLQSGSTDKTGRNPLRQPARLPLPALTAAAVLAAASLTPVCNPLFSTANAAETAQPSAPTTASDDEGRFAPSTQQFDYASGLLSRKLPVEAEDEFSRFLKLYPNDSRVKLALFRRGESRFSQGKFQQASVDYYEVLRRGAPEDISSLARIRYGCCLFELSRFEDAIKTFQPLLVLAEKRDDLSNDDKAMLQTASYYLGRSLQQLNKLPEAEQELAKVQNGEFAPLALLARADMATAQKDFSLSAKLLGEFSSRFPTHALTGSAKLKEAESLRQAGKLPEASLKFEALFSDADPVLAVQARYGRAWIDYKLEKYSEAASLASAAATSAEPLTKSGLTVASDAHYLAGLSYQTIKKFDEAIAHFDKVKTGDYIPAALRQKAWAAYALANDELALKAAAEYAKANPKQDDAELAYLQGKALMRQKRHAEAVPFLKTAAEKSKDSGASAAYDLGLCYEQLAKYEDAATTYDGFLKKFPGHANTLDALLGLGRSYAELEKYEAGLQVYARILAMDKITTSIREYALNQQAVCYYWLKQFANMNRTYEQLLKEFPKAKTAADALYWMAWHAAAEKRFAQSAELYSRLLREHPDHKLAPYARYRRAMSLYSDGRAREAADELLKLMDQQSTVSLELQELLWLGAELMEEARLEEAERVYAEVLKRDTTAQVKALALFQQAEARRTRQKWDDALKLYDQLKENDDNGVKMSARFGAAVCLRKLKRQEDAVKMLDSVQVGNDDPLAAHVLYEQGMLDIELQRLAPAVDRLMRVGLLYDDQKLAGEALLRAAEACKTLGDLRKTRICLRELSGETPDSYGMRYPDSQFTAEGKKRLAELDAQTKEPVK